MYICDVTCQSHLVYMYICGVMYQSHLVYVCIYIYKYICHHLTLATYPVLNNIIRELKFCLQIDILLPKFSEGSNFLKLIQI